MVEAEMYMSLIWKVLGGVDGAAVMRNLSQIAMTEANVRQQAICGWHRKQLRNGALNHSLSSQAQAMRERWWASRTTSRSPDR